MRQFELFDLGRWRGDLVGRLFGQSRPPMFGDLHGDHSFLRSEDGINWQPISQPPTSALGEGGFAFPGHWDVTEDGWLLTVDAWGPPTPTFEMWSSVDGDTWEPVDVGSLISDHVPPPVPLATGGGSAGGTRAVSPDLVSWSRWSEGGLRTTWIVEVTPPSS